MEERIIVAIPVYNEGEKIGKLLQVFPPKTVNEVVVINDGSTDITLSELKKYPVTIINHNSNLGIGAAIKSGIRYAIEQKYDIFVVMSGNGKDNPQEIPKLLKGILEDGYDYIQGSRFLTGGSWNNLPRQRYYMIKLYTSLFNTLTKFKGTDITNGFRAYRLSILNDKRINIWQDWLDRYELEYYLHWKVIKLGYKIKEVPVSKNYPDGLVKNYSKIRPIIDWWKIIRPLLYLTLKIKQ
jgi:dolichol-phosphate mannosyltransferase